MDGTKTPRRPTLTQRPEVVFSPGSHLLYHEHTVYLTPLRPKRWKVTHWHHLQRVKGSSSQRSRRFTLVMGECACPTFLWYIHVVDGVPDYASYKRYLICGLTKVNVRNRSTPQVSPTPPTGPLCPKRCVSQSSTVPLIRVERPKGIRPKQGGPQP